MVQSFFSLAFRQVACLDLGKRCGFLLESFGQPSGKPFAFGWGGGLARNFQGINSELSTPASLGC